MIQIRTLLALTLWIVSVPERVLGAPGFCDDLKAVLASTDFYQLMGKQRLQRNAGAEGPLIMMWESTKFISGFQKCRITRVQDKLLFSCDMAERDSLRLALRDYTQVEKELQSCLVSPSWEHEILPKTSSGNDADEHDFRSEEGASGSIWIIKIPGPSFENNKGDKWI